MYGIEINEFPAMIAEVAMWLVDHQMNQVVSAAFGMYFVRLPLIKSATIRQGNALRMDWNDVLSNQKCSYVLGNPPFVGNKYQSRDQATDLKMAAGKGTKAGSLDYVAGWYFKATEYIHETGINVAFVSTNSITQGEQVGVLFQELFRRGVKINFGHRTFSWESEARGKAHVHVVIIGFGNTDWPTKRIYDYESDPNTPSVTNAKRISPYLVDGPETAILKRTKPISSPLYKSVSRIPEQLTETRRPRLPNGCQRRQSMQTALE